MCPVDRLVFNGRIPANTLIDKIKKTNLLKPQPVDRLSTPFLFFIVDFDAESGADGERDAYLSDLWQRASEALTKVFQHCQGFDTVETAQDFCRYVGRCQVETTMPFNDYWSAPPALGSASARIRSVTGAPSWSAAWSAGRCWRAHA